MISERDKQIISQGPNGTINRRSIETRRGMSRIEQEISAFDRQSCLFVYSVYSILSSCPVPSTSSMPGLVDQHLQTQQPTLVLSVVLVGNFVKLSDYLLFTAVTASFERDNSSRDVGKWS